MSIDQKLPYSVSEYIKEHFREDFLFEVKQVRQAKDRWYYTVEITKDNYIHTITFNDRGEVMKDDAEQAFPPDTHEEPGY